MFQGQSIQLLPLDGGLVELRFDRQGESINKFDARTVSELREATALIAADKTVRGVLVSSAKDVFIVGADITEFGAMFKRSAAEITAGVLRDNEIFFAFEDLPIPSVIAINGYALGGGLEMTLCGAWRVMSDAAQVGVPEVKLGLFPGFGGTLRLARVAGPAAANEWVAGGKPAKAAAALAAGVVDEVVPAAQLRDAALAWLRRAAAGEVDWQSRQRRKREPLPMPLDQQKALFDAAKAKVVAASGKHQPAALAAIEMMERAGPLDRAGAQQLESEAFGAIAKTQAASSLAQAFINDQALKKLFRRHAKNARPVTRGAVLGAGIMGGGIAITSALRGTPVVLKDITQAALDQGLAEAGKQVNRQVKSGRLTPEKAQAVLAAITPTLDDSGLAAADVVIEAIVENLKVKHAVLAELEGKVRDDAVIASNTSSLRIDDIAAPLTRPQNFVGMHFFNPVPMMPLVEVIQGSATSEAAVSTAVGYAVAMGKTPIVVKDCPGFLVNRILTAYMRGFLRIVEDGADFRKVDRVMEAFGWPMGPAYLEDVVGMDTGSHVSDVISAGYPERMPPLANDALRLMVAKGRFGQKNGIGFYRYETDPNGKPKRAEAEDTPELLKAIQPNGSRDFADTEIIERLMLPMIVEAAHAFEDGVVATPAELDMALLLGIGFPAYLGGPLKYADWLGLDALLRLCEKHAALGPAYRATRGMREMAARGATYY